MTGTGSDPEKYDIRVLSIRACRKRIIDASHAHSSHVPEELDTRKDANKLRMNRSPYDVRDR